MHAQRAIYRCAESVGTRGHHTRERRYSHLEHKCSASPASRTATTAGDALAFMLARMLSPAVQ
eukprot:118926-Pleurochrysis_carterae.AAC.1